MPITYYPTYKNSSGNVGIGNINPSYRLDVKATTTNGSTVFIIRNANDSNNVAFYDNGTVSAGSDFRAPIFYDSNNTSYYVDPASTSNLNSITLNNSGSSGYLTLPGSVTVSNVSSSEIVLRNLTQLRFSTSTSWDWNAWAGLKYDQSATTIYLGGPAASGGVFTANATPPSVTVSFVGTSNVTSDSNVKAPIFYDSNDTTYYVDPASTSKVNTLYVANVLADSASVNGRILLYGNLHIDAYGANDIYCNYYSGKRLRAYKGAGTGAETFRADIDGIIYAFEQFRTPIVYDYNNTAYYIDPASTSVLNALTVGGESVLTQTSVTFTPSGIGWYRILTAGGISSGTIRTSGFYDNRSATVEFDYTVNGWGNQCYVTVRNNNNYSVGLITQIRVSNDGGASANSYLDIYIATSTTPAALTVANFGPIKGSLVASPVVGATAGTSNIKTISISNVMGVVTTGVVNATSSIISDAIYLGDATTYISQSTPYLKITNANGYGTFGSGNASFFHMTTDRPAFYMSTALSVNGDIFVYNTQSQLTSTSVRAPIFYDSGNTAYYLDPANTGTSLLVAGNVGIGTTSPGYKLQVNHTSGYGIVATDGTVSSGIYNGVPLGGITGAYYGTITAHDSIFGANGASAYIIVKSAGNVGIGTSSPAYKLDVSGAINASTYMYAGVFYDNDNTSYYTNPSATSNLVGLTVVNTITGSISGTSSNITAYTINQNVGTSNAPSFAGMTSTAMLVSSTSLSGSDDWQNSPISIRERGLVGVAQSANTYSPNLNFHWASRISNSLWMDANGTLFWGSYDSVGVPAADGSFNTANLYSSIYYDKDNTVYYLDAANTGTALAIAGNAGVGTASPTLSSGKGLHINSSSGHANLKLQSSGRTWELLSTTGAYFSIFDTTGGTDRLAISSAGNVGIGTTSPATLLHVDTAGADARIRVSAGTNTVQGGMIANTNGLIYAGSITNHGFSLRTNDTDRVRIDTSGNVGIGATAPDTNLQVVGHVHVGNQTTFENVGGWNKTIYLDGLVHSRLRILGSAYASGKNSSTETYLWVDNSAAPYSGLATNAGSFQISAGFTTILNSARSPLFYDSDNTSYYVDPASASSLNTLTMAGSITGALDTTASFIGGVCTAASYNYVLGGANDGGNKLVIFVNGSTRSADGGVNALTIRNDGGPFVLGQASYLTSILGSSVTINSNVALHAGNYGGYSTFSGAVTSTYGNFTTPGLIMGDAQYGFYVVSGNVYYKSASGGVHYWRNIANNANTMSLDNSGILTVAGNLSAPIFYDSNDTAYYVDPNSVSRLSSLRVYSAFDTASSDVYANMRVMRNNATTDGMYIGYGNSGTTAALTRIFGGGATTGELSKYSTYTLEPGSFRSPIFYDSDNTAYYIDAASTSNLNGLNVVDANLELYKSQTVDMSNTTTYSTSNYYPVTISVPTEGCIIQIQNNLNSNVPSWANHAAGFTLNLKWRTNGSGWGTTAVRRIIDQYYEQYTNQTICGGITQMTNSSTEVVWLRGGGQYLFKFSRNLSAAAQATTYTSNSQSVTPTSTAQNTIWDSYSGNEIKYNTRTISTSDMYTPILYDWNNSAYYVDPSSTSNLVGLTVTNTITGSVSGSAGSCTGNAATATILATARTIGGVSFNGSANIDLPGVNTAGNQNTSGNAATATTTDNINGRAFYNRDSGNALGQDAYTNNGIGYVNSVSLYGQTDGGIYTSAYSTSWIHQIYGDFRTGQIAIRGKNTGTWQSWRFVLDSSNYTSYSPSLTGTGASGSWGISVTGSSASCTGNSATATSANALNTSNNYQVNSIGVGIAGSGTAGVIGLNQVGTRSWTITPSGGNLNFASGDGSGSANFTIALQQSGNQVLNASNYIAYSSFQGTVYGTGFTSSSDSNYYLQPTNLSNLWTVRANNFYANQVSVTASASTTINTIYNVTQLTLSASITALTFSGIQSSTITTMWTVVTVGNGTVYSITWPAAVKWPGGTAPTITTTNAKRDIYQFLTYDGGTTIYAIIVGQNL